MDITMEQLRYDEVAAAEFNAERADNCSVAGHGRPSRFTGSGC